MPRITALTRTFTGSLAAIVGFSGGLALAAHHAGRIAPPDAPITVSTGLKRVNEHPAVAVDPDTGTALVVWAQGHHKKQNSGRIYGAELTLDGNGDYVASDPFQVSPTAGGQRPSVTFLADLRIFQVMWDTAPRDIPADGAPLPASTIVSRIYTPGAATRSSAGAPPGMLEDAVTVVNDGQFNYGPALNYVGPSSVFERAVFHFGTLDDDALSPSRNGALPRGRRGRKGNTDTTKKKKTLHNAPVPDPTPTKPTTTETLIIAAVWCKDKIYQLVYCVDNVKNEVQYGVMCTNVNTGEGTFTPLHDAVPRNFRLGLGGGLHKNDNRCRQITVTTPVGFFTYDSGTASATSIGSDAAQGRVIGSILGSNRAATGAALVQHDRVGRQFSARPANGPADFGAATKLWKIKKNRLGSATAATTTTGGLVIWSEAINRKGTKSRIRAGWFETDR